MGHPWPGAASPASMPVSPLLNTCVRPPTSRDLWCLQYRVPDTPPKWAVGQGDWFRAHYRNRGQGFGAHFISPNQWEILCSPATPWERPRWRSTLLAKGPLNPIVICRREYSLRKQACSHRSVKCIQTRGSEFIREGNGPVDENRAAGSHKKAGRLSGRLVRF